jgi:hypothetical protein
VALWWAQAFGFSLPLRFIDRQSGTLQTAGNGSFVSATQNTRNTLHPDTMISHQIWSMVREPASTGRIRFAIKIIEIDSVATL